MARLAAAGAMALATTLVGAAPAAQAGPVPEGVSSPGCADGGSDAEARVRAGTDGTDPNSLTAAQIAAREQQFQQQVQQLQQSGVQLAPGDITVPTVVHVLTRNDGSGGVTLTQVQRQMQVLNDAYAGLSGPTSPDTRFRFRLDGVDYTRNSDWYDWEWLTTSDEGPAKRALHVGGWNTLNVYVTDFNPPGLLGFATFPQTTTLAIDGVVVLNQSLPGGNAAPYNEGDTLTHEVGHWLNLYHTFESGCLYPGDSVSDTPYQADGDNIFFCRVSDDTCPKRAGKDPVHNFMSYGDDPCLDRFTPGQADRMLLSWQLLRARDRPGA